MDIRLDSEADLEALAKAARERARNGLADWKEAWDALGDAADYLAMRHRWATSPTEGPDPAPDASL